MPSFELSAREIPLSKEYCETTWAAVLDYLDIIPMMMSNRSFSWIWEAFVRSHLWFSLVELHRPGNKDESCTSFFLVAIEMFAKFRNKYDFRIITQI